MTPDWLAQPGLMLFTENFDACVAFYRDTLGLPVLFDKGYLVTLGFGSGYLMIEKDGVAVPGGKSRAQSPVTSASGTGAPRAPFSTPTATCASSRTRPTASSLLSVTNWLRDRKKIR